jgi:DNA mismatch endonuclease, patch repair protein
MADVFSPQERSAIMSKVRSRENERTEIALIRLFREHGIRGWRRHQSHIFGTPDFAFQKQRVAIFVDGCFWHCCRVHGSLPTSNTAFWAAKLQRNRARDRLVNKTLRSQGWRVVRVWQHELHYPDATRCLRKIYNALSL